MPFAKYAEIDAVNQSSFAFIDPDRKGCPAIWKVRHLRPRSTPALEFGRALHSCVLEPDDFRKRYVVRTPDLEQHIVQKARDNIEAAKAQKAAKREAGELVKDMPRTLTSMANRTPPDKFNDRLPEWAEFKADLSNRGGELLTERQADQIDGMMQGLFSEPKIAATFKDSADSELVIVAELADNLGRPTLCKARLDILTKRGEINDLKGLESTSQIEVGRFVWKYRAFVQAAFYLDCATAAGIDAKRFSWSLVEKLPPYPPVYHCAEPDLIKLGRRYYRDYLTTINDCRESGEWPGHNDCPIYPAALDAQLEEVA